jgi:TonB-linked SusC/RagA family outer membrane protein
MNKILCKIMNNNPQYRGGNYCLAMCRRLYMFIFFALAIAAVQTANAQNTSNPKISITIKKNQTLKRVFEEIESKSSYHLIYDPDVINDRIEPGERVFSQESVSDILKKLGFNVTINNRSVILTRAAIQNISRTITGRVTDTLDQPMAGVTISIKGDGKGTATDARGRYTIQADESQVLVFKMVSFSEQEVVFNGQANINIVLHDVNSVLNDVVVVGYGTQKRINLTGAVSAVKMDEVLGDRPVTTTGELLEGTIPGFQVTQVNGAPGASKTYNIRGATDIPPTGTGNTISSQGPLILLDNVPLNSPLNLLDPNDIESVTVLKDAGSAAIYGARSAFGVVLITTKKGKKNQKVSFNYSDNLTLSTPTNLPQKATVLQTLQSYKDAGTIGYWTGNDVDTWLGLENKYLANPGAYPDGYATVAGTRYELATHNAYDNLLGQNSKQFMHNFSATGGSDKTTYRISLGTVNENGILVPSSNEDYYNRYNVKSNVSSDINKWMNIQMDASYYNSLQSTPTSGFNQATNLAPYTSMADSLNYNGATNISLTPKNAVLLSSPTTDRLDDTRLAGKMVLKPFTGLTVTGEYTFDNLRELNTSYDKITTSIDPRNFAVATTGTGAFRKLNAITDYHAINIFANYVKNFRKHHLSFLVGFNQEDNSYEEEDVTRTMPISNNLPSISQSTGPITADDNYSQYAIRGYFGRVNYDYDGKYLLEVNGRDDASSKFPEGHRSGFFPSFSAGWLLTKEKFMQSSSSWLNELKIRGSFGSVGNQSIDPYQFVPGLTSYTAYWLSGNAQVTSLNPPALVSSNFTWETVQTTDLGLDFGVLKNRLTGSFDIYQRDTKNMLYKGIQLPAVLGAGAPLENVAALRSQGFEVQLNWRDRIGKVSYRVSANLYDYISKITKIQNQAGLLSQYYVGQQLGEIYGYVTDRLYTVNDFVPGTLSSNLTGGTLKPGIPKIDGALPNPGDVLYKDLNHDGVINAGSSTLSNPGDRKIIGNNSLRYQYGISGGVSYKGFDFSFVTTGVGKQDQFRANILSFPNYYGFGTIYAYQLNYWTPSNTNAFYGRTYDQSKGNQAYNEYVQTRYLLNGANFRVKNLTLAYAIPAQILKKISIDKFSVFFSVENAITFDHLPKGSDPAISPSGTYGYDYPFMRLYSIGTNITF